MQTVEEMKAEAEGYQGLEFTKRDIGFTMKKINALLDNGIIEETGKLGHYKNKIYRVC